MHRRPITKNDVYSWFALFGISSAQADEAFNAKTLPEAIKKLTELKEQAKKAWRKLAFDKHPDRNNGQDEEFKQLNNAYDNIQKINVHETPSRPPPPPRPPMQWVRIHVNFGCQPGSFWSTSTNAGTGTGTTGSGTIYW